MRGGLIRPKCPSCKKSGERIAKAQHRAAQQASRAKQLEADLEASNGRIERLGIKQSDYLHPDCAADIDGRCLRCRVWEPVHFGWCIECLAKAYDSLESAIGAEREKLQAIHRIANNIHHGDDTTRRWFWSAMKDGDEKALFEIDEFLRGEMENP